MRRIIDRRVKITGNDASAGGWGSVRSLANILVREGKPVTAARTLMAQNKANGFACVSCAWPKPAQPHPFEYCENGAKATAWETTSRRTTPDFFAKHTLATLRQWPDYDLEQQGRLTEPMRWDSATDTYKPVSWQSAFDEIGRELRSMAPNSTVWYSSGRASLETSFMWALAARLYGTNNLPDSSNMCHESTSVGLKESIGVPVGTTVLEDMDKADCILFFGQNPGSNSPRALHPLQDAHKRGVPIITFNPIREPGLEYFTNPQSPLEMVVKPPTPISSRYHQVKLGGDIAALLGIIKALITLDDKARHAGEPDVLDHAFIAQHTDGFEALADRARTAAWPDLEARSGLNRSAMEATATIYAKSHRVIAIYGMGITQHRAGVEAVQMIVNLLLLRGNIGKPGAGICPVRGHSNVQGQRTVGISEKPALVPLGKFAARYGFNPPRDTGLNTVDACQAILSGRINAFLMLGGNFVRAVPEREAIEAAWRKMRLTVTIATKLNRSHLVHGEISYILPCLGRIEIDRQASGDQAVSVEDSTACIHGSRGVRPPAGPMLLSEPAIVAGIAKATLDATPAIDWDSWVANYARIRTEIGAIYPDFETMETRMWQPGGFRRNIPASHRIWETETGRATFIDPKSVEEDADLPPPDHDVLTMMTMRSNDQFNTTIYGYNDRFRGIKGTRMVVLMNRDDMARLDLTEGVSVTLATAVEDGTRRQMSGFRVTGYDIPSGCVGTYYPETNALIPLWHHADRSKVPAAKSIPIRIVRS
ncbi:MAG: formate dehydrogenase [Acidiphilium sp. 37-64-53]|uniref:FdhF/YdeP family oxidoreductase n=1 Tax=Acidiphilium TaxID=522 RepID=UPI000BC40965|nr:MULTISPECIES: FdhF/YdeP family oxidoreductase [Acidiphilium]OYW02770.1 MAG: formate dehydrogenase [Acidiphilium sp. 37-64-53]OZB29183.1 MAG: formate dehydrogenase [Acidiphilium sp. 34-64-41]HQT84738.1 FdhF/YdeP family oxidoreductase [Acidiphilium rubrum]